MKIIAKVNDDRVILEASVSEVRTLGGLGYNFKPEVGTSVDVQDAFNLIESVKSVTKELSSAVSNMDSAKKRVEEILKKANKAIHGKVNPDVY